MNSAEGVLSVIVQAMQVMLLVSAPLLLATLVTGVVVSILQAATQINEMTLSFIPKLVAVLVTLAIAGPWMLSVLSDYARRLITGIPSLIG